MSDTTEGSKKVAYDVWRKRVEKNSFVYEAGVVAAGHKICRHINFTLKSYEQKRSQYSTRVR